MSQPFVIGETYFSVFYADQKLRKPMVETLIYLGPDTFSDESGTKAGHLFQYAESFHSDGSWNEMSDGDRKTFDPPPIIVYDSEHSDPVVDGEGLISELREWRERCNR